MSKLKMTPGSGNVFTDLGFSPEEASLLQMRAVKRSRRNSTKRVVWNGRSASQAPFAATPAALTWPVFLYVQSEACALTSIQTRTTGMSGSAGLPLNMWRASHSTRRCSMLTYAKSIPRPDMLLLGCSATEFMYFALPRRPMASESSVFAKPIHER